MSLDLVQQQQPIRMWSRTESTSKPHSGFIKWGLNTQRVHRMFRMLLGRASIFTSVHRLYPHKCWECTPDCFSIKVLRSRLISLLHLPAAAFRGAFFSLLPPHSHNHPHVFLLYIRLCSSFRPPGSSNRSILTIIITVYPLIVSLKHLILMDSFISDHFHPPKDFFHISIHVLLRRSKVSYVFCFLSH